MKESKFVEEIVLEGLGQPPKGDILAMDQHGIVYRVDAVKYERGNAIIYINKQVDDDGK